jgi:hypothetical protein
VRRTLFWIGGLLCGIGLAVVVAGGVMTYKGLSASYNFGDPTKFQFVLVPFWQIGLAIAGSGAVLLVTTRWLKRGSS